jgi:hypothetical protein
MVRSVKQYACGEGSGENTERPDLASKGMPGTAVVVGPLSVARYYRAAPTARQRRSYKSDSVARWFDAESPSSSVSDAVHLLAEVIENATIFPQDTQVHVAAQDLTSGGVLIEVIDGSAFPRPGWRR